MWAAEVLNPLGRRGCGFVGIASEGLGVVVTAGVGPGGVGGATV